MFGLSNVLTATNNNNRDVLLSSSMSTFVHVMCLILFSDLVDTSVVQQKVLSVERLLL